MERIFKLLDAEEEEGDFTPIPRYQGAIRFENVSFGYEADRHVLKNINLDIQPGEMVGIVGHTGSGKSTLMSLLMRFYDLKPTDHGRIFIDGVDAQTYSKRTYRQHMSIILQDRFFPWYHRIEYPFRKRRYFRCAHRRDANSNWWGTYPQKV